MYIARAYFEGPSGDDSYDIFVAIIKSLDVKELVNFIKENESELNELIAEELGTDVPEQGEYTLEITKNGHDVVVQWLCEDLEANICYEYVSDKSPSGLSKLHKDISI